MIEVYTTMRFYYQWNNITREEAHSWILQLREKLPFTSGGITFFEIVSISESMEHTEVTIKGRAPEEFAKRFILAEEVKYDDQYRNF